MIFPTLEFVTLFLLFLAVWQGLEKPSTKIATLSIFNVVFYGFYNPLMLFYLLGWAALLYFFGKYKKFIPFLILFSTFQLFFWKFIEAKIFPIEYKIITPLGISFFTFQGLTYIFGLIKKPSHLSQYHIEEPWYFFKILAFTGFFPTVLSGPILRAKEWENQIYSPLELNKQILHKSLCLIALGCLYKLCFSSIFHDYVQKAFSNPSDESIVVLFTGMYSYSLEIFHDFAGYSLISIGIGGLMGFSIPANFNKPYFALNMKEFWQRWHISLSSWLRDYLYFYLGGSRYGSQRQLVNIAIVMTLSGLWHGISLNYLIWGFLHTLAIIVYHVYEKKYKTAFKINKIVAWILLINYVSVAWIFFRSPDIHTSFSYLISLTNFSSFSYDLIDFKVIILAIICLGFQYWENKIILMLNIFVKYLTNPILLIAFWALVFIFILIVSPAGMPPFIYFSY